MSSPISEVYTGLVSLLEGAKAKSVKETSSEGNLNQSEIKEVTNPRIKDLLFECDQCDSSYKKERKA